jgi:hypothetical protein
MVGDILSILAGVEASQVGVRSEPMTPHLPSQPR